MLKPFLINEISQSFPPDRFPSSEKITPFAGCSGSEDDNIQKKLSGRRWDSLSVDEIISNNASLHFMVPEYVVYFLPAFLCEAIRNVNEMDVAVYGMFSVLARGGGRATPDEIISQCSKNQKNTICSALDFFRNNLEYETWLVDIETAISLWKK